VVSAARSFAYCCEPLAQRLLLDGDPVIVLTEAFSLTTWPTDALASLADEA
jgi:hypothetical protein